MKLTPEDIIRLEELVELHKKGKEEREAEELLWEKKRKSQEEVLKVLYSSPTDNPHLWDDWEKIKH